MGKSENCLPRILCDNNTPVTSKHRSRHGGALSGDFYQAPAPPDVRTMSTCEPTPPCKLRHPLNLVSVRGNTLTGSCSVASGTLFKGELANWELLDSFMLPAFESFENVMDWDLVIDDLLVLDEDPMDIDIRPSVSAPPVLTLPGFEHSFFMLDNLEVEKIHPDVSQYVLTTPAFNASSFNPDQIPSACAAFLKQDSIRPRSFWSPVTQLNHLVAVESTAFPTNIISSSRNFSSLGADASADTPFQTSTPILQPISNAVFDVQILATAGNKVSRSSSPSLSTGEHTLETSIESFWCTTPLPSTLLLFDAEVKQSESVIAGTNPRTEDTSWSPRASTGRKYIKAKINRQRSRFLSLLADSKKAFEHKLKIANKHIAKKVRFLIPLAESSTEKDQSSGLHNGSPRQMSPKSQYAIHTKGICRTIVQAFTPASRNQEDIQLAKERLSSVGLGVISSPTKSPGRTLCEPVVDLLAPSRRPSGNVFSAPVGRSLPVRSSPVDNVTPSPDVVQNLELLPIPEDSFKELSKGKVFPGAFPMDESLYSFSDSFLASRPPPFSLHPSAL